MGKARSPNSIEAEELYKRGMSLADISRKMNVPASTVRRWKSTQDWDGKGKKKESERSDKKKASARIKKANARVKKASTSTKKPSTSAKKASTPKNKGGAPVGNKNAMKHGAYSQIFFDALDEEEQSMIEAVPDDDEQMILDEIKLYTVRERRIMKAINMNRDKKGGAYTDSVMVTQNKRKFDSAEDKELYKERIEDRVASGERLPGEQYTTVTKTSATVDLCARLERELTAVQRAKEQAINNLARLRIEKQKLSGDTKGNDVVRAWADAVIQARRDADGTE